MKDSLFEMLLTLFEKTLTQLKEKHQNQPEGEQSETQASRTNSNVELAAELIKSAQPNSMRVFTVDEQMKLTKLSYQFLMRMLTWGIISTDILELVMNRLLFSDSRFVALQETKWAIRSILADNVSEEQLAFLDLVLYQKEDGFTLH